MTRGATDVGGVEDLDESALLQVSVDGQAVLLSRHDGEVSAVAATCPHAGGPLKAGVRFGRRIVCPWHKAIFCLRTGEVLEPPALDRLARYDVEVAGGRILLQARPSEPGPVPCADARCFVIIGAGAAGAVAAQTLREAGFGGRVIMLDRENRVPYDRTLLSKYTLSGKPGAEKTPLQSQAYYREHRIERRTAEVTHLDVAGRRITCADGSTLHYDAALLATGCEPQRPDLPGMNLDGVFLLRSMEDAQAILARAERSERAVVLGASFIGMEVAASLRERGLEVTVVGREAVPFEKQLGPQIGAALQAMHERHGVTFRLGRGIRAVQGDTSVSSVVLDDGETIPAEMVVMGFGVRPATGRIAGLALNDDGSITVDAQLRAAEGLYAAGDIARFPGGGSGALIRVEHWRVAEQHGRTAALAMLGQPARHDAAPVFWTIQYLKRVDYIGHASKWDEVVLHGDLNRPEFLAYYVKDGIVLAAAGMGRDRDTAALGELFGLHRDWTPAMLGERPAEMLGLLAQGASRQDGADQKDR